MLSQATAEYAAALIEDRRSEVEAALLALPLPAQPALLYDPVRYVLEGGGKRLRPVLLLMGADAFKVPAAQSMPAALAVEIFHNFTLVHDDIMDHAETRRGKQAVHKKWDVGTALLSGDYLVALSYELLSSIETPYQSGLMNVYHHMVRLLCEGQAMDKAFETQRDVSVDAYIEMIDRKTGALLGAVFELAGCLGGVDPATQKTLNTLGLQVGRAFQIQDDLLDLTAENPKWGKKIGGDLIEGKKAYLLLRAIETIRGDDSLFFTRIVDQKGIAPEEIPEARRLMEHHGILDDARQSVLDYTSQAMDSLAVLPSSEASDAIRWLIQQLQIRMH